MGESKLISLKKLSHIQSLTKLNNRICIIVLLATIHCHLFDVKSNIIYNDDGTVCNNNLMNYFFSYQ